VRIDALGLEREAIAGRLREQDFVSERLAEGGDGVLERAGRRCGRAFAPEIGDEPIGRDGFAGAQRERGEQRPLLAARQCNGALAVAHLERPRVRG
jgi:hypothetical protein